MTNSGFRSGRRQACLAGVALLALPAAQAQAPRTMARLGVFALLGDAIQVVQPDTVSTGSRLDRSGRYTMAVRDIGFDNIALRAVRDTVERGMPSTKLSLYRSTNELSPSEQRGISEGAARAELPDWIVKAINTDKLTHVLLITRHRGEAVLAADIGGAAGRGMQVEGIGFFIDPNTGVRNTTNGIESDGSLGAYVQLRLTLMDAQSGALLLQQEARDGRLYPPRTQEAAADPWKTLGPEEKAEALRKMVREVLARAVPAALRAA